jgi:hypothetical protein
MIKYFKDVLRTLKAIEKHLDILASTVQKDFKRNHNNGKRPAINTKGWND